MTKINNNNKIDEETTRVIEEIGANLDSLRCILNLVASDIDDISKAKTPFSDTLSDNVLVLYHIIDNINANKDKVYSIID